MQPHGLHLPVRPVKGYSLTLDMSGLDTRPGLPVVDGSRHTIATPMGDRLRIAGTAEFAGLDPALREERVDNLRQLLKDLYPDIAPQLLAGEQAVEHLARTSPDTGLRCLTDAPVRARAEASGFDLAPVRADHVLLGRMAAFNLACLERVVADLTEGARLLVANADRIHPDPAGNPIPETGAWLAAIKACLPDVAYECFGKPSTHLPAEALRRSGAMAEDAVFIGDNPETDGLAADRLGMDFIEIKRFPGPANLAATQTPDPAELARC